MVNERLKLAFGNDWYELFADILESEEFTQLPAKLIPSFGTKLYPSKEFIFERFKSCPYDKLKVIFIAHIPYIKNPFKNSNELNAIFKEIEIDIYDGLKLDFNPYLPDWSKQGVLLLNTTFTILNNNSEAHTALWKPYIEKFIKRIGEANSGLIYILWDDKAKEFLHCIDRNVNFVLTNNKPFSNANRILLEIGKVTRKDELIFW